MKKIFSIIAISVLGFSQAQVIIGDQTGTASNKTSVLLEFAAGQNKGIILPYVRTMPTTPTEGTILVDSSNATNVAIRYYNGSWKDLSNGNKADISTALNNQPTVIEDTNSKAIIGASSSSANGVLVLESTTKAMVLPQVASTDDIINPAPGMMVYINGTNKRLAVFNGSKWTFWAANFYKIFISLLFLNQAFNCIFATQKMLAMNSNFRNPSFLTLFLLLITSSPLFSQFTIVETFRGSTIGSNVIMGGHAKLTSGFEDPINNGWLRLTNDTQNQRGYTYIDTPFPATMGAYIEFEYKTWRSKSDSNNGGDGFSVFLFDAATPTFQIGAYGGSLGYAQLVSGSTNQSGLAGGYLGIGFDEYGNFANANEGKNGGTNGLRPNTITLRGPANPPSPNLPYRYLTHKQLQSSSSNNTNSIDYNTTTSTRPSNGTFYRRVKIFIETIGTPSLPKYKIRVLWRTSPTGNDVEHINFDTTDPIPSLLKLGFAASSGGAINFHEIRNLVITTTGGVSVQKYVDTYSALPTNTITYTVNVPNDTMTPITNVVLTDLLKDGNGNPINPATFTLNSITFNNNGDTGTTASGFTSGVPKTTGLSNPFSTTLNIAAKKSATFTIVGKINTVPAGGTITNTASLDVTGINIIDADKTNNSFTVSTTVLNPATDLKIEKGVDNNGTAKLSGNTYTLLVSNVSSTNKPNGATVTVKDNIPTGLNVTGYNAPGWTVSNTGNQYTFTRTDILNAGYAYPEIKISVTPSLHGSWTNTATLEYTDDTNLTNNSSSVLLKPVVCYNDATLTGTSQDTKVGITLQNRAGSQNSNNWPMVRKGGHLALESNNQGFVITRMNTAELEAIKTSNNAVEGMISYDIDAKCLKIYNGSDWKCFNIPSCP